MLCKDPQMQMLAQAEPIRINQVSDLPHLVITDTDESGTFLLTTDNNTIYLTLLKYLDKVIHT